MGGTIILWQALRGGQIDVYPEYTGTIGARNSEKRTATIGSGDSRCARKIRRWHDGASGFNNTYALVMRRSEAQRLGIRNDQRSATATRNSRFGLTHEFLDRQDGWRPLHERYGLPHQSVIGIDHALGYAALANGSIDVKDAYSTDAKIEENDLVVLRRRPSIFPKV